MEKSQNRKNITGIIVGVAAFIVAAIAAWLIVSTLTHKSNEQVVQDAVSQAKAQLNPPQQIDQVTTLDDITAEKDAIRYHYTVAGADTSKLTKQSLEDTVRPKLCAEKNMKTVLDRGVHVQYAYTIKETGENYLLDFTKNDC